VPPWLAVTSSKRFKGGLLSTEQIIRIIRTKRPDVVVLDNRWTPWTGTKVQRSLRKSYRLVHEDPKHGGVHVYVRRGRHSAMPNATFFELGAAAAGPS
jgi:hypothetical protein